MRHLPLMGGYPQYCLPQNCRLGGNPEVGNFELVHHQDCLPYFFIFGGFIFYSCFFWISCPICLSMILMSFEICFLSMYSCFFVWFSCFFYWPVCFSLIFLFFRLIFLSARLSVNGRGLKVAISSSTLFQHFPHILAPCATIQPKI